MKILSRVLNAAVDVGAAIWNRRAAFIEVAGGAVLVVAGTLVTPALGWCVAGVALVAKAQEVERKARRR